MTPGVVPLRPLTVGELLDGAVKVIRRYPRPTLGMSAIVTSLSTLISVLIVLSVAPSFSDLNANTDTGTSSASASQTANIASIPARLVEYIAALVLLGAVISVVGKAVLGQQTTTREVWDQVRPRIWALIGLSLLTALCWIAPMTVGILLAVVLVAIGGPVTLFAGIPLAIAGTGASVYLYSRLALAPAVLVLEKAGVRAALRRSGVLVKGDWWRVFGILLLAAVISSIVSYVLLIPAALITGVSVVAAGPSDSSLTTLLLVTQVVGGLARFLVTPFSAGVSALLYVDRRMRAEGLDLTLQAAARG